MLINKSLNNQIVYNSFLVSLLLILLFTLIQPFNFILKPDNIKYLVGLAVINFFSSVIHLKFFRPFILAIFRKINIAELKKIIVFIFSLLWFSIANYFYLIVSVDSEFLGLNNLLTIIYKVSLIALLVIVLMRTVLKLFSRIESHTILRLMKKTIILKGETNPDIISFKADDLVSIQADDNYIIISLNQSGLIKKEVIRCSLKSAEQQVKKFPIIRCHRSFLVNTNLINKMKRKNQGFVLELSNSTNLIPISKPFEQAIKSIIASKQLNLN